MTDVTIKATLDEESKKLLKATIAAVNKLAAASGKSDDDGDGDGDDGDDNTDFDSNDDGDGGDDEGPSLDDVGEAMKAYATAPKGSKALAMKILKEKGKVEVLSKLKPANFKAVIDACTAATKKLKAAACAAK